MSAPMTIRFGSQVGMRGASFVSTRIGGRLFGD
jgi:hypothetical protein